MKKYHILLLGDGAVGKTSLIKMFTTQEFSEDHMVTLGIDFMNYKWTPPNSSDEMQIRLWDTAGQEKYQTMTHSFYKNAHGVVFCYDIMNPDSLKNIQKWLKAVYEHGDSNVCKIMVGNKIDMACERKVEKNEAVKIANEFKLQYFEASAKTNHGVSEFFHAIFNLVYESK